MAEKKSIGEIHTLVSDFEKKYSALHNRMDGDFDLWRLKDYKLDQMSDNVTSTYPRFYAQAILGQMSGAKPILTVHRMDGNGEKEALMERGFFGWLRLVDENLAARLLPPLQSVSSFMAAIRGGIAGRGIFYKDGTPEIFPYDPRYLSWGMDSKGVIWSAYSTWREPYSIEFEYNYSPKKKRKDITTGKEEPATAARVIEWIDGKYYMVIVDNQIVNDSDHSWERPPVFLVPVGTSPMIVSTGDKYDYIDTWLESIYGSSRALYEVQNRVLSIWLSLLGKSHDPSYFVFTPDGQMKITDTPWGKGQMMPLPSDAKVQLVEPPDIANSAPQFFNIISTLIGQGDYTPLFYGQLYKGQELSGRSLQSIYQNVQQVKGVLLQSLSVFYKIALKSLGSQYLKLDNNMTVSGYDSKGTHFISEVTPDIYDGDYELEVDFRSIGPEEEAENYAKAQLAKTSMLASDDFIRENIIKFQDPDKVSRQMYVEAAEKINPQIAMMRMIEALQKEGKNEEAAIIAGQLKLQLMQSIPQQGMGQQGQSPKSPEPQMPQTQPINPPNIPIGGR